MKRFVKTYAGKVRPFDQDLELEEGNWLRPFWQTMGLLLLTAACWSIGIYFFVQLVAETIKHQ